MKETMTVHEALCEAKVLEKRVRQATNKTFVTYNKCSNTKIDGDDISVFKDRVKADYQSVCDLIKRFSAIKEAISLSNAKTMIEVCGKQMSVAEALWQMKYGVELKENLLYALQTQYNACVSKVNVENTQRFEEKLERFVANAITNAKEKTNSEDLQKLTEVFKKQNTYELIDPIGIEKEIKELEESVNSFKSKVDSCLQTSNATTIIEIEY